MAHSLEAAGFVLACVQSGAPRYLLLRSAAHGTWGAPKGHLEPDESSLEAAIRETREETSITDLRLVEGFRRDLIYEVNTRKRGSYTKRVTYFLALTPKAVHVQSDEHNDSGWFTLQEALARVSYDGFKQVLLDADAHLRANLR